MNSVHPPTLSVSSKDFFHNCASRVIPLDKRKRLKSVVGSFSLAIDEYYKRATSGQLHAFEPIVEKCCGIDKKDFKTLYDSFMVSTKGIGREHYDRIRNSARLDICPYCSTRQTASVDHFLPESFFPQFSVTFENLVPSCTECNKVKLNTVARVAEEMLFHPYFDAVPKHDWLDAIVMWEPEIRFEFFVSNSQLSDSVVRRRIENQFSSLNLDRLFAFHAAVELDSQAKNFDMVRDSGGAKALESLMRDLAANFSTVEHNPWKSAMYRALADDHRFLARENL